MQLSSTRSLKRSGKFKNEIISLHLNEEQLQTFQEKLGSALKIMKDRLDGMWNRFKEEEEEEEQK